MALTLTAPAAETRRIRVPSVLRSEWTKIRTVRSTMWSLAAMAVATIGIGAIAIAARSNSWNSLSPIDRLTFDPTRISLTGLFFSQLVIGVLGVLVMSAEYGTGTIRSTLAAVPHRPLVLAAKTAVFAAVSVIVAELLSFSAFFIGQALVRAPAPHAALSQPGVLRAVVGAGLVLAVLGLLALGLATIIRHTAGAISTYVGLLLVLPILVQALPSSMNQAIGKYLPFNISDSMATVHHTMDQGSSFGPWVGFAILCGYALAALVIGGVLLVRRDA